MNPRILFTVDGQVVGSTRSRKQAFIVKLLRSLADLYRGRTVEVVYPEGRLVTASRSRARKPSPGRGDCVCGRVGETYALVLCQDHAPIPYEVTDRGRREVGLMKQWDAIHPSLVESAKVRAALLKAARADGRRIEARVNRESTRRQHTYIEIEP